MQKQIISLLVIVAALSSLFFFAEKTQNSALELYQQWKAEYGQALNSLPEED